MTSSRALLSALHAAAVQGAAPFLRTRQAVDQWLDVHTAGPDTADVPIHVFALGKAAWAMAEGACAALEARGLSVTGGIVVSNHLPDAAHPGDFAALPEVLRRCLGDHPVPGPASLEAADAIDDAIGDIAPGALALVLLSGGTTALCAAPIPALSQAVGDTDRAQAHVANLAQTLLESGLAIHEMNAIRRRVLRFGAGRLATALARRGVRRIGTFAISDVIGDHPAVIGSGPCSADALADEEFLALLDAHDLRGRLERAMSTVLGLEGRGLPPAVPAADDPAFGLVDYTLVATNRDAVDGMAEAARAQGIANVLVDAEPLEGDADAVGRALIVRALRMAASFPRGTPTGASTVLLSGGEPVVNLRDTIERAVRHGDEDDARRAEAEIEAEANAQTRQPTPAAADEPMRGGRMQVVALAAALALEEVAMRGNPHAWQIAVLAAGTDGRDGPTDAAGAIVDTAVPALARRAGRTPEGDLETGRSWFSLHAADALLRTGPTGTNVMDVVAVLIRA